jgi:hypothetical protein
MVRRTHSEAQRLARKFKTPDPERTRGFAWLAWGFSNCGPPQTRDEGLAANREQEDAAGRGKSRATLVPGKA